MHASTSIQTRKVFVVYCIFAMLFFVGLAATFSNAFVFYLNPNASAQATLSTIKTKQDMDKANSADLALVFSHVDWSMHSEIARIDYLRFVSEWRHFEKSPRPEFYFLDFSDGRENVDDSVTEWLQSEPILWQLGVIGCGELVLMRHGKVIDVLGGLSAKELNSETINLIFNSQEYKRADD